MIVPKAERLGEVRPYYFVKKLEQIAALRAAGHHVISFGVGSPDLPPSENTINALIDTVSDASSHGYQLHRGLPELRAAIAKWYANVYDVALDPEKEVLPLLGSKEGILHVTLAFANPGDEVLVPNPGYPTYTSLSKLLGVVPRPYLLDEKHGWYPDFHALADQDLSKVKMMWLNYPHMPTGTPAQEGLFDNFVRFAQEHKILLCHDNPYSLVLPRKTPISILSVEGAKEVAVEVNSFSKSHNLPGWRVGMLLGAEDYLSAALTVKSNIDSGMFKGTQKAAIAALDNPMEWHQAVNDIYAERREGIHEILDLLGFEYNDDQEGMFVWAKPKNREAIPDIEALVEELLTKHHLFFTPGFIFGSQGHGYLRASLCVPIDQIQVALERVRSAYA